MVVVTAGILLGLRLDPIEPVAAGQSLTTSSLSGDSNANDPL
jgi:hypothetical protein